MLSHEVTVVPESPQLEPRRGDRRLILVRPGLWTFGFMALVGVTIMWLWFSVESLLFEGFEPSRAQLSSLVFSVLLTATVLRRIYIHAQPLEAITIGEEYLTLPRGVREQGSARVPLTAVLGLSVGGAKPFRRLILETERRAYIYEEKDFASPHGIERFYEQLLQQIRLHPESSTIVTNMRLHGERIQSALQRRPLITQSSVVLVIVGFFLGRIAGIGDPVELLRWGALSPTQVWEQGEIYRLFSNVFLHWEVRNFGLAHVALASLGLMVFGSILERLIGHFYFFLVLVASALGASLIAASIGEPLFFGATPAVFGVGSAYAILQFHPSFPPAFKQGSGSWVMPGVLALAILLFPGLAPVPHIGASVLGSSLCWWLSKDMRVFPWVRLRPRPLEFYSQIALGLVYVGSFLFALQQGSQLSDDQRLPLMKSLLAQEAPSGDFANVLAWTAATEPSITRPIAERAKERLATHLRANPRAFAWIDTIATLEFRLGDAPEAVRLERQILEQVSQLPDWAAGRVPASVYEQSWRVYASQLARFLHALPEQSRLSSVALRRDGPLLEFEDEGDGVYDIAYLVISTNGRPSALAQISGASLRGGKIELKLPFEARIDERSQFHFYAFGASDPRGLPPTLQEQPYYLWLLPQRLVDQAGPIP